MEVVNMRIVKSSLMQHQVEAVKWMADRENSSEEDLPPFWSKSEYPPSTYRNSLVQLVRKTKPAALRGGILADDMGLGKTLSIIALIASNGSKVDDPEVDDEKKEDKVDDEKADDKEQEEEGDEEEDDERPLKRRRTEGWTTTTTNKKKTSAVQKKRRATLVVCPLSVMSNWVRQIEEHTEAGSLKLHVFHGSQRYRTARALAECDVVITTYAMLSAEWKAGQRKSVLRKVPWLRVVLDEAHVIKSSKAQHTKCAVALDAERRWAVTGTPLQNSAADVFSLVQFLHLSPLDEARTWKTYITTPLKCRHLARQGFERLQNVVSAVTLRRTKEETRLKGEVMVDLPPKVVELFSVQLNERERKMYDEMEKGGRMIFQQLLRKGTANKRYALILEILLRLRQICDDPTLCKMSLEAMQEAAMNTGKENSSEDEDDGMDVDDDEVGGDESPVRSSSSPVPQGKTEQASSDQEQAGSSKAVALISLLEKTREKDPSIKSVVFSQFSKMLKLLEDPLRRSGFNFVKIDGSMSASQREQAMEDFKSTEEGSPTVFLLSLKAAGVGLNLVSASNVYMMDPWWNPAVEDQAMDRVHRVGQTREVHVVRMIASKTIEERILKLQEKKRAYAEIALGDAGLLEPRLKRCIEDVKLLLGCN